MLKLLDELTGRLTARAITWAFGVVAVLCLALSVDQCSRAARAEHKVAKYERAIEAAKKQTAKREAKAQAVTTKVAAKVEQTRIEIRYRTKFLVKEVPTYVTPAADSSCTVPVGFVRLHDAAASGSTPSLPGASGGSVDAPSGVPLSAVSETVVSNYGVAYDWRAEALGWRDWYVRQRAAWEKR